MRTMPVAFLGVLCLAWVLSGRSPAVEEKGPVAKDGPYPLDTCPVSGKKLGDKAITFDYEGRAVKFCCPMCVEPFKKDPTPYLKKLDDAVIAMQKPTYPLTTCVVTGESLSGADAKPHDLVYHNRLVRFCCPICVKDFMKDPNKYLLKIDQAAAKYEIHATPATPMQMETPTHEEHK